MTIIDRTLHLVDQGHTPGAITAIPTGLPKYDDYLYGVRPGTLLTLIAETSVGKTSLGRDLYMHRVYDYYKQVNNIAEMDVQFTDFSLEMPDTANMANAIVRKAYLQHGKVLSTAKIFGWGSNKLTTDEMLTVKSYRDYFLDFEKKLTSVDTEVSAKLFHAVMFETSKRLGKWAVGGADIGSSSGWIPNNPRLFWIVLLDTINLAESDKITPKSEMDQISSYARQFRNKCNAFICIMQQISAEISSTDRSRFGVSVPNLRDPEDSRRMTKDSNIVLALYDPLPHMKPDQELFKDYNMAKLKGWFRTLHVLKHREGRKNVFIPLKFYQAVPYVTQLPEAFSMTEEDYSRATTY